MVSLVSAKKDCFKSSSEFLFPEKARKIPVVASLCVELLLNSIGALSLKLGLIYHLLYWNFLVLCCLEGLFHVSDVSEDNLM
jgi:hypothetical protein